VVDVRVTDGEGEVVLAGRAGRANRFPESEVPLMGRVSQGVRGIKLKPGEEVTGMAVPRREGGGLCLVTVRGWARRLSLDELQAQGRGGMGTVLLATSKEAGEVVAAREVHPGEDLMAITTAERTLRLKPETLEKSGRAGPATRAFALSGGERISLVTYVAEREQPAPSVGAADDEAGDDSTAADGDDFPSEASPPLATPAAAAQGPETSLEVAPPVASAAEVMAADVVAEAETALDPLPPAAGESPAEVQDDELDLFG
jgi:DNA gyrase subunit A